MTSPISLLALLGGSGSDPASQTQTEDPALFAAALVAALQQLRAPIRPAEPVPVLLESNPGAEEAPAEEGAEPEGTAPSSAPATDAEPVSAEETTPRLSRPVTLGQTLAASPKFENDELSSSSQVVVDGTEVPDRPGREPEKARLDPKPEEPALPPIQSTTGEIVSEARPASDEAPAPVVMSPAPRGTAPREPLDQNQASGIEPQPPREGRADPVRPRTRSAPRGELLVGDWSPPAALTGWSAPIERDSRPALKRGSEEPAPATDQSTAPVVSLTPLAPTVIPPVAAAPPPVEQSVPQERREPGPTTQMIEVSPPAPEVDGTTDPGRQVQVANARLAAQLAELVGDHNVTEFRVQLGRARAQPDATKPQVTNTPAQPVTKPPAQPDAPISTQPQAKAPLLAKAETAEPGIAAPLRAARAAAGPIVPDVRKEIPAGSQPERKTAAVEPEKPKARDNPASDSRAAGSTAAPGPGESLTSRSDSVTARESREARNLPQESPGNERPAGSADRVTLQISDAEGRQTRIRVSVLGDQVRAVIIPPDSESARQLEQRMDDLQTALARQGFASSRVSVQPAGESVMEHGGVSLAPMNGGSESRAASPGRDQPAEDQRQGRGQREQQQPGGGHRHPNGRSRDQGAEHRRRHTDA